MLETLSEAWGEFIGLGPDLRHYFDAHHRGLQGAILGAFAFINSIRIVAYVPQILKASRDGNGASAISCLTWGLFLASHLTTIAYAVVYLGDMVMALIFLGNAFACIAIISVTVLKRRSHKRVNTPAE